MNVVASALSRKTMHSLNATWVLDELCREFQKLNTEVMGEGQVDNEIRLFNMQVVPSWLDEIRRDQIGDTRLDKIRTCLVDGKKGPFELHDYSSLRYQGRWCIPHSWRN